MDYKTAALPSWYQALTLTERLTTLREAPHLRSAKVDTERAGLLLERWRTQAPFAREGLFSRRLDLDGVAEEELRYLLGESAESLSERRQALPEWLRLLSESFSRTHEQSDAPSLATILSGAKNSSNQSQFLFLIEPLFDQALNQLRTGIRRLAEEAGALPFDPRTIETQFIAGLLEPMLGLVARMLALELNVARLRGQLSGDTPEARFRSFVESLRDRDRAWSLLEEYPALGRQLTVRIGYWTSYVLEFLRHLADDRESIASHFSADGNLGLLAELKGTLGDSHREGRSVLIAKFTSGLSLVYKPKPLAVDVHFQELLAWLNERGSHPPFRTLKVFDRGKYGWVEFVTAESCATADEVTRFYQRQGAYLALLYVLQATDFHQENLIAAGEHPVLVDLESLFHPGLVVNSGIESEDLAGELMHRSVIRVGLLPQRIWINGEGEGIDISGLGGVPGQIVPFKAPTWEGAGTDEMRISRGRVTMPEGQNRPSLNGAQVDLLERREDIIAGFKCLYQTLRHRRDELLADDGPLARFVDDEVRIILRPSNTYARLLQESYHPDLLRSGLDRDRHFDWLWGTVEMRPELARVIADERRDLQGGDIPIFTARVGALDLWTSAGDLIPDWFKESSLDLSRRLISELNQEDLDRQEWVIRASLTSLSADSLHSPRLTTGSTDTRTQADRGALIRAARRIGDRLERLAVRGRDDAVWLGLTAISKRHWALTPLGIDLYDGLPGVILFLAYLSEATEDERYQGLARAALNTFQRQLDRRGAELTSVGGFSGWGGVIYTLAHLDALWKDHALLEQAEDLIDSATGLIERDQDYDIIAGAAGYLAALLSFYRYTGSPRSLAAAVQCGEHLLASSRPMEMGLGWCGRALGELPLAGFSHGSAGIASMLLQLAAVTQKDRYRTVALETIEYERSLFSSEAQGWLDLRKFDSDPLTSPGDPKYSATAWCHGASGIGLGRLSSLAQLDNQEVRAEIQTALELTLARGFGQNHSLCHGDLGNLDFLLQAQVTLGDKSIQMQIERLSANILESIELRGPLCGVPQGVETPGLMTGLAGIGYGLLRLAEPARFPSVLALLPPSRITG